MQTSDFHYDLPPELIAQQPADPRDASRLLIVSRGTGELIDTVFSRLPDYLVSGDVLVANESRVVAARLEGVLPPATPVELLLIRRLEPDVWEVMAKPARRLRPGSVVVFPGDVTAEVVATAQRGRRHVRFWGTPEFESWLNRAGKLPIPPYIRSYEGDPERYQTVYSRNRGSIAAPTAGLHFTSPLLERIRDAGVQVHFLALHVGPGTFQPVREEDLSEIAMEPEQGSISAEAAEAIVRAKQEGRRVVAVGTTTTRLLEGVYEQMGEIREWAGEVDLFIRPPFSFHVVDGLITNFHLPRSTLLMLVAAFAGWPLTSKAYDYAVHNQYRFYSFGDAMFIL